MKSFFEEFGFVILSAVVVVLLIGMASPLGTKIEGSLTGIVEDMTTSTTTKLDNTFDLGD